MKVFHSPNTIERREKLVVKKEEVKHDLRQKKVQGHKHVQEPQTTLISPTPSLQPIEPSVGLPLMQNGLTSNCPDLLYNWLLIQQQSEQLRNQLALLQYKTAELSRSQPKPVRLQSMHIGIAQFINQAKKNEVRPVGVYKVGDLGYRENELNNTMGLMKYGVLY